MADPVEQTPGPTADAPPAKELAAASAAALAGEAEKPPVPPAPKPQPVPEPEPPKEGYALFAEKFFQIRRAAFQTGCIAGGFENNYVIN